jgi:hypothetical protein
LGKFLFQQEKTDISSYASVALEFSNQVKDWLVHILGNSAHIGQNALTNDECRGKKINMGKK